MCLVIVEVKIIVWIINVTIDFLDHRSCHISKPQLFPVVSVLIDLGIGNDRLSVTEWIPVCVYPFFGKKTRAVVEIQQTVTLPDQAF